MKISRRTAFVIASGVVAAVALFLDRNNYNYNLDNPKPAPTLNPVLPKIASSGTIGLGQVSDAIARKLQDIDEAVQRGELQPAADLAHDALNSADTLYEKHLVRKKLGEIYMAMKFYAPAALSFEAALGLAELPAVERNPVVSALIRARSASQDHEGVIRAAEHFRDYLDDSNALHTIVAQAYFAEEDFSDVETVAQRLVANATRVEPPDEELLRLWVAAAEKRGRSSGKEAARAALIKFYPNRTP